MSRLARALTRAFDRQVSSPPPSPTTPSKPAELPVASAGLIVFRHPESSGVEAPRFHREHQPTAIRAEVLAHPQPIAAAQKVASIELHGIEFEAAPAILPNLRIDFVSTPTYPVEFEPIAEPRIELKIAAETLDTCVECDPDCEYETAQSPEEVPESETDSELAAEQKSEADLEPDPVMESEPAPMPESEAVPERAADAVSAAESETETEPEVEPAVETIISTALDWSWPDICNRLQAATHQGFNGLADQLSVRHKEHGQRSLLLAGTERYVGRTSVAVTLAQALIDHTSLSVCLIDADFEQPGLAYMLGILPDVQWWDATNGNQFSAALPIPLSDRLGLLPLRAPVAGQRTGTLELSRAQQLFKACQARYDLLVIDAGPWKPGAGPGWSTPSCDMAIEVMRHRSSGGAADLYPFNGIARLGVIETFA